jgi:nucleoid-associated protein YgaU
MVHIMQGNFRPEDERADFWDKLGGTNQNNPNSKKYIGAIVEGKHYRRESDGKWSYYGDPFDFSGKHGRVMSWDFDAWNSLIVEYPVQANDTLSSIALKHWGNGDAWKRIWWTNQTKIGSNPDKLRAGMKLFIWK